MKRQWYPILICLLLFSKEAMSSENVSIYSVHIGMNASPNDSKLPKLRYADDDAARMFMFLKAFSTESVLAAVLDTESQQKYGDLISQTVAPRESDLRRALEHIASSMEKDKSLGNKVVFYFSYSGHGEKADNGTRMLLLDGFIDRDWLENNILKLPADVIHLIIDTCYAEGVVDSKGIISSEADAKSTAVSDREMDGLVRGDLLEDYPHVGVLVSASKEREAYEWSQLGSGVFTHELLSALEGAADVNGDGDIAYSEAASFISAANRSVENQKARPQIVSHPPLIDRNSPIMSFKWAKKLSFLHGNSDDVGGRFSLETDSGLRFLDAHLEPNMPIKLIVPSDQKIWIRNGDKEASFIVEKSQIANLSLLTFQKETIAARGGMETALQHGLFATRFGPSYYIGWIDSRNDISVLFLKSEVKDIGVENRDAELKIEIRIKQKTFLSLDDGFDMKHIVPITLFSGGGLSLVTSAVFLGFGIDAKRDFDSTTIEKTAFETRDNCKLYTGLAIGFGAATVLFAVIGAVITKHHRRVSSPTFRIETDKSVLPGELKPSM